MTTTNNAFADWTKLFGEFKTPAVDVNQIISHARRNAETGSAVFQIFSESTQAIARRQAEILRLYAEQTLKASKDMLNHSTPETAAAKQADFAKSWLESNANNLRELAEISGKATKEALALINARVAEQVKEFSDAASTTTTKKKAA